MILTEYESIYSCWKAERNRVKKLNPRCYRDGGRIINEMGKFGAQVRGQSWGTESGMDEISGTRGKGDNPSLVDFSQAPRELVKRQQGRETVNQ